MADYLEHHGFRRGAPEKPRVQGPPCQACGEMMLAGQRGRHHLCDGSTLVGERCTCPPGCTDKTVGDQGKCAAGCEPCRIAKGARHQTVTLWQAPKKS